MAPRDDVSTIPVGGGKGGRPGPGTGGRGGGGVSTGGGASGDAGPGVAKEKARQGARIVECQGECRAPGLVDIRVELGDLAATVEAAVSGGVTSMVCLPTPELVIYDMSAVEFVPRRARQLGLPTVCPPGPGTQGPGGPGARVTRDHARRQGLVRLGGLGVRRHQPVRQVSAGRAR